MDVKGITIFERKIGDNLHTYLIPQKSGPGEIRDFLYDALCYIDSHLKKLQEDKKPPEAEPVKAPEVVSEVAPEVTPEQKVE